MHGTASECPGRGPGCISWLEDMVKITKINGAPQGHSRRDFLEFLNGLYFYPKIQQTALFLFLSVKKDS